MPRPRRAILIAAGALVLTTALYLSRDHWTGEPAREAGPAAAGPAPLAAKVITRAVVLTGNDRVFEAIGTGRARRSIQIYPAVAGEVTAVRFEAQDWVEHGALLVQLDDREEALAVRAAQVELDGAESLLARYEQAVTDGAVPQSEVDSARSDVDAARVALEQARLALEERKVKAPFTGVVGIAAVDRGERIDTGTVITSLDDRRVLYVDFEIPEALAGALRGAGAGVRTVTARTPAFPDRVFTATISAEDSRVDGQRRTLRVRASIDNREDLLRPGMSFETRWEIPGAHYPTVPEIALRWGREGSFIWVVREGQAERVPARVVARTAGRVLLDAAVEAGEPVVVEGLQRLRPGAAVEVLGEVEA